MERLVEWIQHAKKENANELLIVPQSPLRARSGKELINISAQKLNPSDTRQLLLGILDEEQRHFLETLHHVQGVAQIDSIQFRFSIDQSLNGLIGSVSWLDQSSLDNSKWEFHPSLIESLNKAQGLILVAGAQGSGKTAALHSLIWKYAEHSNKCIALFSDFSDWDLPESALASYSYFSTENLKVQSDLAQYADLIVIDGRDPSLAAQALQWAEAGKLVILSVVAGDWMKGLERVSDGLQSSATTPVQNWRRLSQNLTACLGLKLVKGLKNSLVGLHEMFLVDTHTRAQILNKDFPAVQEVMRTQGEKNGMHTMNQSILQALLKRTIELRTGFDASPDPTQLDVVLKKIGI